jgi:signal transduction histidine kinase
MEDVELKLSGSDFEQARLVVIDDEPMITQALRVFFELEMSISPTLFNDPATAVEFLAEHEVDLIISDIMMPGIDGIELLRRVREVQPDTPRVVLTGFADKNRAVVAINEVGVFQFLEKPWHNEQLRRLVLNVLERKLLVQRLAQERAKLVQAEKLSSVGLFAAGVAHEINNPLSGVMACLKALYRDELAPDRREEYFTTAQEALERMQTTIRDLLDYARQREPTQVTQDASDVVRACVKLVAVEARKKAVRVRHELPSGELQLRADRSQLMQVLINLLVNAVYAAPAQSGAVTVRHVESDPRHAGRVGISVIDNGPGIAPDVLRRAREPFFTTKPEGQGTGLGLSVADGIVRAHGGELEIISSPGNGTTATLWLPGVGR